MRQLTNIRQGGRLLTNQHKTREWFCDGDKGPDGRREGPPGFSTRPHPATAETSRTRSFARTHALNANANAIEIDFPVRVLSHD